MWSLHLQSHPISRKGRELCCHLLRSKANSIRRPLISSLGQAFGRRAVTALLWVWENKQLWFFLAGLGRLWCPIQLRCVNMHVPVQKHVHMGVCAYGDQRQYQVCSSITRYLLFWDRIAHWPHGWTGWAVSFRNPRVSALGLQMPVPMPHFPRECLGIWTQVSRLAQRALYCLSPSLSLCITIFEGRRENSDHILLSFFAFG